MSIRILHVVTYMGRGGLETMLMNYYRHMDRDKVQFDFLVHREFEADYDEEIKELGGRIYHVSRLIPWSRRYRKELKEFFQNHPEYKVVHIHQDCLSSVALQCAMECGISVRIAHCHSSSQNKNLKYLIKLHYMKKIPRYATDLFACSEQAGRWMFGNAVFKVLYNAIEVEKYRYCPETAAKIRSELGIGNELVIGHIGRFRVEKNHEFLIDIFIECLKQTPEVKLLLVGDGERRKEIEDKVKNADIQDKVIFAGVRSDVNELLQAMDIFVFPSLYEGLGISVIEAQASGLPCAISENVPDESIIVNSLVKKMSLKESAYEWAKQILEQNRTARKCYIDELNAAGYDIVTAAQNMEQFYLKAYERE